MSAPSCALDGMKYIRVKSRSGLHLVLSFHRYSRDYWSAGLYGRGPCTLVHVSQPGPPRFYPGDAVESDAIFLGDAIFELPPKSFAQAREWFDGLQVQVVVNEPAEAAP